MRRARWFVAALALFAACGGGTENSANPAATGPATVTGVVEQVGEDFYAPEFSVTLADGSTLDTAAIDTPVYVMFWAEW